MGIGNERRRLLINRLERAADAVLRGVRILGQIEPGELLPERITPRHPHEMVDRTGRARRHAVHTKIADFRIDDVIVGVMRHRAYRAGRFAGIAADADRGVDQVLHERIHILVCRFRFFSSFRACSRSQPATVDVPGRTCRSAKPSSVRHAL
jgi:hypothetical protein